MVLYCYGRGEVTSVAVRGNAPMYGNVNVRSLVVIPCLLAAIALPCRAQLLPEERTQALSQSPKITASNSPLDDFRSGAPTARVIVNLREPAGIDGAGKLATISARQKLRGATQAAQDRVIASLSPADVGITHTFSYIFGFAAEVTPEGLQELIDSADVLSVEKDQILEAHLAQGIPLMNASTARSSYNGSGLSIAICDTGIDYTHPMLGGGGFPNSKVIGGYDCGDEDTNPMDAQGHGTCCAGIAAGSLGATGDYIGGVAYNAKLYAVKIAFGSGGSAYTSDMIQGWEWCITNQNADPANPILIISTSFGGDRFSSLCDDDTPAMTTAAANAVAAGITIFASSGNDGYCDSMGWPACISHVISVGAAYDAAFGTYYPCVSASSCASSKTATSGCSSGWYATDSTAADRVTSYSNTASFLGVLAPSNRAYTTDIVGAGGYSTGDYYSTFGGTSAACPYAAGAAACLQSAAKALTGSFLPPDQVRSLLIYTGAPVTDGKVAITKPRIDLGSAVDALTPSQWVLPLKVNLQPSSLASPTDHVPEYGFPFSPWIRYGWLP
jgi:subtilisin family serine protease